MIVKKINSYLIKFDKYDSLFKNKIIKINGDSRAI